MKIEKKWFQDLTKEELFEMYRLRINIFVVEQECAYQEIDDFDLTALHVFARDDAGVLVGYGRVYDAGDFNTFGRVLILPKLRNQALGSILVQTLIDTIKTTLKDKPIQIHAIASLKNFYEKRGFKAIGPIVVEDGIEHIDMEYCA